MSHVTRTTVDLSDQPDLVVIYLGMRVRRDGDSVAVVRDGRAAVQVVAEFKCFAHASAERVIVGAGEKAVDRQAIRRRLRHRCIVSR